MDAEIQFFMTEKDQETFLAFSEKIIDSIDKTSATYRFIIGDCELLFSPSIRDGDILYMGKLEIRQSSSDMACKDQLRAINHYKKLRNWLKKNYWSRLAYINKNKKDKLMPSRVHWLGADAKKWKETDSNKHILKLSTTSWMVFDIGF